MNVISVSVGYMIPGPSALRTALMSFVASAISSPVGVFWKKARGSFWMCARKSLRRSNSTCRETTMIVWRVRNVKIPATREKPTTRTA